jgi:hypothetical protein
MKVQADSPKEYIDQLAEDRKKVISRLRDTLLQNLPEGFEEQMTYGMIGYVVPHELYPAGYHCDPKQPLPFLSLASQKNFVALYHSGIYADPELHDWFVNQHPNHCKHQLDMGKSCIRFKHMQDIPYDLIGELVQKLSVEEWVELYERRVKR